MAVAAAELTPTETPDRVGWGFTRSRRTQAVPRHSLFGTNLDRVDQEELKDIEGRYIPEGFIKESPNRYPLPPYIKERIPGRNSVQTYQKQFAEQRDALTQADHQLKDKSEKSLSFRPSGEQQGSNHNSAHSQHPTWLSEKDLKHSKDINIVGLSQQGSYNRDKYQKKPQVHNYSLIGDILAPKMDFNSPRKEGQGEKLVAEGNTKNIAWGPGRHLPNKITEQNTNSKKKNLPKSVIDLPPNIRHQFGSRICDSLLSDQDIVSLALERQKSKMGPTRPSKKENIESLPLNLAHNYESLGNTTRYNVCPGVSSGHTISRTKDEFNDEVHHRRVPATDEFRCQRDELSTWSEHNVLRERMKKAWNEAYPLGGKKS